MIPNKGMQNLSIFCKHCEGERIYLREIRRSDVNAQYCRWMNDEEVIRYTEGRFTQQTLKTIEDFVISVCNNPNYMFFAIILKDVEKHIGNIKVGPIDWNHLSADIGILIGEKSAWGKGYATEAIKLIIACCFNDLKLHKLTAGAYASNRGSIRAFIKAGFTQEGILKNHYIFNNSYEDRICLGIINE